MAGPLLEVEDLSIDLPTTAGTVHAVRSVSLSINAGETLCLVGESGCGKSMTALALMNLLPRGARRSAARMQFEGQDLTRLSERQMNGLRGERMAMIFQEPMTALNPAYTIGDQLTEGYRLHRGASAVAARTRAVELLQRVGIANAEGRLGQYPHQLSGGLRQRVMIAMALMGEPRLLIADEPTTALDVTIQAQILRLLIEIQREFGLALLFITHDLGVVARIASRVAVMYAGRIVEQAPTSALFAAPRHPYTAGLLACLPVPGRTVAGGRLGVIPGTVPALTGDLTGCAFRARCPHAAPACAASEPWHGEGEHHWRCIHEAGHGVA